MSLVGQLGDPSGRVGAVLLHVLNVGNRRLIQGCLAAADLGAGDRVLDIGFGGGALLRRAQAITGAPAFGLDRSALAAAHGARLASRKAGPAIACVQGDAARPPFVDGAFDAVFLVNVIYFVPDAAAACAATARLLAPGGRLVLGCERRDPLMRAWSPETVAALLAAAGLTVNADWARGGVFAVVGRRGA